MDYKREIVLDTETTGLDPLEGHKIIEIGCVELINKVKTGKFFHTYINPQRDVPKEAFKIHGISTEFLKDKPLFSEKAKEFIEFIKDSILIIHNATFDIKFLNFELGLINTSNIKMDRVQDTLIMARKRFPGSPASLDALCKRYNIDLSSRTKHGALLDAELLADVYIELCGGIQSSLDFESQNKTMHQAHIKTIAINALRIQQFKEPRNFMLSLEEINSHKEFINLMKNALWSKFEE